MKRTSLLLDDQLLAQAVKAVGAKTGTEAVHAGLRELVRQAKAREILKFAGTGIWKGDLAEMRGDHPRRPAR